MNSTVNFKLDLDTEEAMKKIQDMANAMEQTIPNIVIKNNENVYLTFNYFKEE